MTSATAMGAATKAAAVGFAATVETASGARPSAGRICPRDATMIEAAEGAGMST
jgi:hypothetical protein